MENNSALVFSVVVDYKKMGMRVKRANSDLLCLLGYKMLCKSLLEDGIEYSDLCNELRIAEKEVNKNEQQ